jgi:DDE family transposase
VQGYNAQAACNEQQIVVAAEVSVSSADFGQTGPMIEHARVELAAAGITDTPEVVLADAGYWHGEQIDALMGQGVQVLIPPDADKRRGTRPGWDGGCYAFMRNILQTDTGGKLYGQRQRMIEPVVADTTFNTIEHNHSPPLDRRPSSDKEYSRGR